MCPFLFKILKKQEKKTYNLSCSRKTPSQRTFIFNLSPYINTKAVVGRCCVKKVFLKILQNSQENTRVTVSF